MSVNIISTRFKKKKKSHHIFIIPVCLSFFLFSALVRPVKALKVWPELVPEQLSLLPLLSCDGPGGQVRMPLDSESGGVWCPSGGDDSCCHGNGVLLNSCE